MLYISIMMLDDFVISLLIRNQQNYHIYKESQYHSIKIYSWKNHLLSTTKPNVFRTRPKDVDAMSSASQLS